MLGKIFFALIHTTFQAYTIMIFVRLIGSWFPNLQRYRWMYFMRYYTDPYLNIFRRIIPPLGGVLDISPVLGFFALDIMEKVLISVFRVIL